MQSFDPEVSFLRSVSPDASRQLPQRQNSILLPGLQSQQQEDTPELADLLAHREQTIEMQTRQLEHYAAQVQASITSSTAQKRPPLREILLEQIQSWKTSLLAKRRHVPVLTQMSIVECGAACLAMVLSYYGCKTSVSEARERCGVGRNGLTALQIVKAARSYGLRVRAVALQENDFTTITLPAIVHWEFNHFLIVERWSPHRVHVVDPAIGRRRLTGDEFDAGFTGVVLQFEPGEQFQRRNSPPATSLRNFALRYVKQSRAALFQILAASLLLQLFGLAFPLLTKVVVDQVIPVGMDSALTLLGVGMLVVLLAQMVTMILRECVLLYVQTRIDMQMISGFLEHLFILPLRFFQQRSSGDILSRLQSNMVIRSVVNDQLISTLLDGGLVMVYFFILLSQSLSFSLFVLLVGLLQGLLLLGTNNTMHLLARSELAAQGKAQGHLAEALAGIATVKAAGVEPRILKKWSNLYTEQMNASLRRQALSSLIQALLNTLRACAPLLLLWIGAVQVTNGSMQLGTMLALNALGVAFLVPLASLVASGQSLQLVHSHLERIADVLETPAEQEGAQIQSPPRLTGRVMLHNVHFQYDPGSPPVLHDIHLNIQAGQKVALVGRTGSGKSTLGSLLLGMLLPTQGEIFYDGIPLRTLDYQAVRAQFGVVMQNSALFSGTIRENITLSQPDMKIDRIIKAAQAAGIHDDIMQMPMEYETYIAEGGSALSGGQRQRIALARALINAPAILLLDEATSALDVVTEQVIEQNLRKFACTQIIIAHRLSTVQNADLILVLDQGTIIECGSHADLIQRNGYYAHLIQSQLASGDMKAIDKNY